MLTSATPAFSIEDCHLYGSLFEGGMGAYGGMFPLNAWKMAEQAIFTVLISATSRQ